MRFGQSLPHFLFIITSLNLNAHFTSSLSFQLYLVVMCVYFNDYLPKCIKKMIFARFHKLHLILIQIILSLRERLYRTAKFLHAELFKSKFWDKFLGMIQYLTNISCAFLKSKGHKFADGTCGEFISICVRSFTKSHKMLRNSRRIFRFAKLIKKFKRTKKTIRHKTSIPRKILMLSQNLFYIMHYTLDHILWFYQIGALSEFISESIQINCRFIKQYSSAYKIIFNLIKCVILYRKEKRQFMECLSTNCKETKRKHEMNLRFKYEIACLSLICSVIRCCIIIKFLKFDTFGFFDYEYTLIGISAVGAFISFVKNMKIRFRKVQNPEQPSECCLKKTSSTDPNCTESTNNCCNKKSVSPELNHTDSQEKLTHDLAPPGQTLDRTEDFLVKHEKASLSKFYNKIKFNETTTFLSSGF